MSVTFGTILGSLRVLRRRALALGAPGLTVWTNAGERAAACFQKEIRSEAHRDEVCDSEAEIALTKALEGGLDASDKPLVEAALRNVRRSREAARRIGEAMT